MKKPEPLDIEIPIRGGTILYSWMDEFSLRRLYKFIGELIEWKAAGNSEVIETKLYAVVKEGE